MEIRVFGLNAEEWAEHPDPLTVLLDKAQREEAEENARYRRSQKRKKSSARKRKSSGQDAVLDTDSASDISLPDLYSKDPRFNSNRRGDTCNGVRKKIEDWIETGGMKVGEFQERIGVSPAAYRTFMNRTGVWDGTNCDTYWKAADFFRAREAEGLPIKLGQRKRTRRNHPAEEAHGESSEESEEDYGIEWFEQSPGEATE